MRVFQTAAWMWLVYLVLQSIIDLVIYSGRFNSPVWLYYIVNFVPAFVFLGIAYSNLLKTQTKVTTIFLILIISIVPILMNPLLDLKLPQAPLSNIEGMVLRQLPVLMIGLVLVAWNYQITTLITYILLISVFELTIMALNNSVQDPRSIAFLFTIIIRTVCFLVVGIFINQLVTSLRYQQESLKMAHQRVSHYASTLENLTISHERNRMSRELHDTVIHTLSGLSIQLETSKAYLGMDNNTAAYLLDQSLESTRNGLTETRRALKSLRASPLDDLGLIQAVQELSKSAAERANLDLDITLPGNEFILPPNVEQCVYRITQESIENVVHHANAKKLVVKLSGNEKNLQLRIQDDGIGFNPKMDSPSGHYGITGMKERAQIVGGEFTITSEPNSGTTVQLFIKGIS